MSDYTGNSMGLSGDEDRNCSSGPVWTKGCSHGWICTGYFVCFKPDMDRVCGNLDCPC